MPKIIKNEELSPEVLRSMTVDEIDWVYNALDICVTHEVHQELTKDMTNAAHNTAAFSHSLMAPILEMTLRGVRIDLRERDRVLADFRYKHQAVASNLKEIVEEGIGFAPFNYRSPAQLKQLFYRVMGYKSIKKRNANGQYTPTVDRDALEKLQKHWTAGPLCRHIIFLRELDKDIQLLQTDIDDDGRMRTNYNIAGTNTGRLSSSESDYGTGTNNQNIKHALRKIFIPDEGMKFCNVDLEQADARNVGAICWENFVETKGETFAGAYLDACESGDLHTTVCRMAWPDLEWAIDAVTWRSTADATAYREMSYRDLAKRLGHGTNYLGTPRTMAAHTKVEIKPIEVFQTRYFTAFPCIPEWHGYVSEQVSQFGYLETPHFHRRRYFFGRPDDARTLREAVAFAPQSMTADEIDTGLLNLWRHLPAVQLLIQVHDSILFQYPEELEAELIPQAIKLLTIEWELKRGRKFSVPVEAKIGWNWSNASADNPSGLAKWRGPNTDTRTRPVVQASRGFSLSEALNART